MRLAFVSSFASQCGIATYTDDLAAALHARGHEIRVLAMDLDGAADYCGGMRSPYVRCWSRKGNYDCIEQHLEAFRPDVLHVQHEYGLHKGIAEFSAWLAAPRACPTVVTLHTIPIPGAQQSDVLDWMMSVLRRAGCHAIAHQPPGVEALLAYGVSHAHCIPHGTGGPYDLEPRAVARARLRLPVGPLVFATMGFWTPGKRNDSSIHAFVTQRARGALPKDAIFLLAGQPIGEDAAEDLREWCVRLERNGLTEVVQIRPGFVDDANLGDYFAAADVVIANSGPTMYSTSGRGHLAMAYGAAVLAADVPLLAEFRNCGYVFKSQAQLEQGMVELAANPERRAELRRKARDYAAATSWTHVAAAHEAVYREAVR